MVRIFLLIFFLFFFWSKILCKKESCKYFGELLMWLFQIGHLADMQELGSECRQCAASAGSGGTAEDPIEGGTYLLSDDGQYSGL